METRANFVLIGAFTLAVIMGAFMFVLWYSGLARISEHKTYEIVFTGSVSGLSRGGSVLFNGIKIGEVTDIALVPNDPRRVRASIDVQGDAPIRKDIKARLEVQGLTGAAVVALTGGAADAPLLTAEKGAPPPVIVAEPSELQSILESVQSVAAHAESVLDKADQLLSDNRAAVGDAVKNVDAFSRTLNDNSAAMTETMSNIDRVVKSIDGEKVARIIQRYDLTPIRASTSRGAVRGFKEFGGKSGR